MSTATLTRRDLELRDTVVRQLEWDPKVDAAAIGVAASSGAVTLAGFVDTYAGKLAAERAAKRVRGVRAVANELQVRLRIAHPDDEIAKHVAATLDTWKQPHPGVQATIHGGHVTLTGTVRWTDCMRRLIHLGCDFFIELGPGNVLAGLLKRTNRDINVMSVGDAESVRKCGEAL